MPNSRQRIWYDTTMALTFPSVLGTVIYSMLDTGIRESFYKIPVALGLIDIVPVQPSQAPFLSALRLSEGWGLLLYLLITLFVAAQYSCDYLYSKYFEKYYMWKHFVYDLLISMSLGVSFVAFSAGVRGSTIELLRVSFYALWVGFVVTYLVYWWWDCWAWRSAKARGDDWETGFFARMVRFEKVCLLAFGGLLGLTRMLGRSSSHFDFYYAPLCFVVIALLSFWFFHKVRVLERHTRPSET